MQAAGGKPQAVIIATGSEVALAIAAHKALSDEGVAVRVVSMPSTNVFDRQDAAYKASVLPAGLPRVAVEAGCTDGWYKYVGLEGRVIGIDRFVSGLLREDRSRAERGGSEKRCSDSAPSGNVH